MTVISINSDSSGALRLSRHNRLPWQTLKEQRGSGGELSLPIPTKDGGVPDDAQLDHECTGSRDQATRRALYLDASKHRGDVSFSADVPGFVQEDLAGSHVGRRGRHTAIAGVDRRSNLDG
jgi:hypothetical protein